MPATLGALVTVSLFRFRYQSFISTLLVGHGSLQQAAQLLQASDRYVEVCRRVDDWPRLARCCLHAKQERELQAHLDKKDCTACLYRISLFKMWKEILIFVHCCIR
jgi:hypothetical protein